MDLLLAAADLLVCRAGGSTVAELAAVGRAGGARSAARRPRRPPDGQRPGPGRAGAAVLVPDAELDADRLVAEARGRLLADPGRLAAMGRGRRRRSPAATPPTGSPPWSSEHARPSGPARAPPWRRWPDARPAQPRRIHVVGVGGAGMSAIAYGAGRHGPPGVGQRPAGRRPASTGWPASACGSTSATTPPTWPADASTLVAISTAVPAATPRWSRPGPAGVPVLRRAEVLAAICGDAGTRGRGRHPRQDHDVVDAGPRPGRGRPATRRSWSAATSTRLGTGARWDDGDWLVVEADESDGTFLELPAPRPPSSPTSSPTTSSTTAASTRSGRRLRPLRRPTPRRPPWCAPTTRARPPSAAGARCRDLRAPAGGADLRMVEVVRRAARRCASTCCDHGGRSARCTCRCPGSTTPATPPAPIAAAVLSWGPTSTPPAAALAGSAAWPAASSSGASATASPSSTTTPTCPARCAAVLAAARAGGVAAGGVRVPAPPLQPHRGALARTSPAPSTTPTSWSSPTSTPPASSPAPGVTGRLVVDAVPVPTPTRRSPTSPTRTDLVAFLRALLRPGDLCLTLGAGDLTSLPDELLAAGRRRTGRDRDAAASWAPRARRGRPPGPAHHLPGRRAGRAPRSRRRTTTTSTWSAAAVAASGVARRWSSGGARTCSWPTPASPAWPSCWPGFERFAAITSTGRRCGPGRRSPCPSWPAGRPPPGSPGSSGPSASRARSAGRCA